MENKRIIFLISAICIYESSYASKIGTLFSLSEQNLTHRIQLCYGELFFESFSSLEINSENEVSSSSESLSEL